MKKIFFAFLGVVCACTVKAQNPVEWNYSVRNLGNKIYELHLTAKISPEWHIYSRQQPEDAIAFPTKISFNAGALIKLNGEIKEAGKLEIYKDEQLGVSANQYSNKVDFIQDIQLKAKAKTNITGTIEYQACTNGRCLLPKTISFSVNIQ